MEMKVLKTKKIKNGNLMQKLKELKQIATKLGVSAMAIYNYLDNQKNFF